VQYQQAENNQIKGLFQNMRNDRHLYSSERLVSYSDAIFSIVVTLLVIEIHLPDDHGTIIGNLISAWPSLLSFAISFLIITVVWYNHHEMFHHIKKIDQKLIVLNTALMFNIILIPLVSSILGKNLLKGGSEPANACFIYGMWIALGGIPFNWLWRYASGKSEFLREDTDRDLVQRLRRYYLIGPFAYAVTALLAFLNVWLSIGGFFLLMISYFVPAELIRKRNK